MAVFVMVTTDFPGVTGEQRDKIYECLKKKNWQKIQNVGRDISTVWWGRFKEDFSANDAIESSIEEFVSCSKPFTKPRLALHVGSTAPQVYG